MGHLRREYNTTSIESERQSDFFRDLTGSLKSFVNRAFSADQISV